MQTIIRFWKFVALMLITELMMPGQGCQKTLQTLIRKMSVLKMTYMKSSWIFFCFPISFKNFKFKNYAFWWSYVDK